MGSEEAEAASAAWFAVPPCGSLSAFLAWSMESGLEQHGSFRTEGCGFIFEGSSLLLLASVVTMVALSHC